MEVFKTLILEDDIDTLQTIYGVLLEIEREKGVDFITTQYSTYEDVETIVNTQQEDMFDLILLDRDCKVGGSFHALDIEKFGAERIFSISSVPEWNRQARLRGIERVVQKDLFNLHVFADELKQEVLAYVRA